VPGAARASQDPGYRTAHIVDIMSMDLLLILLILLVIVGVVGGVAFSPYVFALIIVAIVLYLLIGRGRGGAAV
jgi:hypothetical protein